MIVFNRARLKAPSSPTLWTFESIALANPTKSSDGWPSFEWTSERKARKSSSKRALAFANEPAAN
jgi:hypothetical protein